MAGSMNESSAIAAIAARAETSDLVVARPEGLYCPPGDFYIDPWRPGRAGGHHPCPFRPRARRPRPLPGANRQRRHPAHPPRRDHAADPALRRGDRAPRGAAVAASGRPRARLGAGAAGTCRPRLGRLRRLQDRARRHLRALRTGALRHLHHRVDLRPADLPLADPGRAVQGDRRLVASQCGAGPRLGALLLCLRQGAADPSRGRSQHRADRGARRGRAARRGLPRGRRRSAADLAG